VDAVVASSVCCCDFASTVLCFSHGGCSVLFLQHVASSCNSNSSPV